MSSIMKVFFSSACSSFSAHMTCTIEHPHLDDLTLHCVLHILDYWLFYEYSVGIGMLFLAVLQKIEAFTALISRIEM